MSKKKASPFRYWPVVVVIAFFIFVLWTVYAFGGEPTLESVQPVDRHFSQPDSISYFYAPRATIVDAGLVGKAFVVVYRQASALAFKRTQDGFVGSVPDRIWQDVYVVRGDSIVFERRIEGRIVPPETVPERIEWGTK